MARRCTCGNYHVRFSGGGPLDGARADVPEIVEYAASGITFLPADPREQTGGVVDGAAVNMTALYQIDPEQGHDVGVYTFVQIF